MNADAVVERICRIAIEFNYGGKSCEQIVRASGLYECPSALSTSLISAYLTNQPEIIGSWMMWSDDKRIPAGWYFMRRADHYVVGFHPEREVLEFTEPEVACAEFIVRDVRAIMRVPSSRERRSWGDLPPIARSIWK